jgi:hypothetical protein
MTQYRSILIPCLALVLSVGALTYGPETRAAADTLPARLDDQEFWRLTEEFSEPNGYFRSDNLLSNEVGFQYVIPELVQRAKSGGVYLGVGPEQNFTYISAVKPKIAFITDIRRGNLHTQLMYKALFELSVDRADFVSRLFSRKRPEAIGRTSTAEEIFKLYQDIESGDEDLYKENLKAIHDLLVKKHSFPLSSEDMAGIELVYRTFYSFGPAINYSSSQNSGGRGGYHVTYADLMVQTDESGVSRGYLANDENFKVVKDLEEKNLIVPLVGNFAGPKAIRAVAKYLKEHNATVSAFYLSNVEQYLGGIWNDFCANVASLPLDDSSTFIRSSRGGGGRGGGLMSTLASMQTETKECAGTGVKPQ